MFIRLFFCYFLVLSFSPTYSQIKYPQGYFRWPLNLAPEIVANLGELRSSHWHMGLDIRTAQKVNQHVYAAAEGYISRIGVKATGFGRFLVITHPNGFSTLYAHLNDFAPAIEDFIRNKQHEEESWEQDVSLNSAQLPVTKGQFIAFSGTTGSSQGPHVHFEIRNSNTDECLNPLLFGMPLKDNVKPTILKLGLYDRTKSIYAVSPLLFTLRKINDKFLIPGDKVIKTAHRKVSLAIQAYDQISGSANQDGIYSAALFFDNAPLFQFRLDSIDYYQTAYMNAHIDYRYKFNGGPFLQHIAQLPGDRSGIYYPQNADGVIHLNDTSVHSIRIEVADAYGNKSIVETKLQLDEKLAKETPPIEPKTIFLPDQENTLQEKDALFSFPQAAFYDTVAANYYKQPLSGTYTLTDEHRLNDPSIPVHGNFSVRLKSNKAVLPLEWQDKLVMTRTFKGSRTVRKAEWDNQWITATFGDFGSFQAHADVVPPTVNELGKDDTVNLSAAKRILFTPTDNFGVKSFRAELNGEWLLFTNDKGRNWVYEFDERVPYGVHHLKVIVTDIVGNRTEKSWWFKRSAYTPPPVKKKAPVKRKTTAKKPATKKK